MGPICQSLLPFLLLFHPHFPHPYYCRPPPHTLSDATTADGGAISGGGGEAGCSERRRRTAAVAAAASGGGAAPVGCCERRQLAAVATAASRGGGCSKRRQATASEGRRLRRGEAGTLPSSSSSSYHSPPPPRPLRISRRHAAPDPPLRGGPLAAGEVPRAEAVVPDVTGRERRRQRFCRGSSASGMGMKAAPAGAVRAAEDDRSAARGWRRPHPARARRFSAQRPAAVAVSHRSSARRCPRVAPGKSKREERLGWGEQRGAHH